MTLAPTVRLAHASLLEILALLDERLAAGATSISLEVLDPEFGRGRCAGEWVEHDGQRYLHRPFRVWVDLAERRGLRLLTPRVRAAPLIELTFEPLDRSLELGALLRADDAPSRSERYGADSPFARVSKLEDPGFVLDLADALERALLPSGARVLDLGINTGDEFVLLRALAPVLADATLVGVDHSASALAVCRARFPEPRVELHHADVATLGSLGLGRFDLVLSIGTLQSPGIDGSALLRQLVRDHLTPRGAVIFGFPNCRYVDGEVEQGARMRNFRQPELGLLVKDVAFFRRYLQQHGRQVFVTGKHYLLVTGVVGAPD